MASTYRPGLTLTDEPHMMPSSIERVAETAVNQIKRYQTDGYIEEGYHYPEGLMDMQDSHELPSYDDSQEKLYTQERYYQ